MDTLVVVLGGAAVFFCALVIALVVLGMRMASAVQAELRATRELAGRVATTAEQLGLKLTGTAEVTGTLRDTAEHLRQQLGEATARLVQLQSQAQARLEEERRTAEAIRRLEAVIAGTRSKGTAGENILEELLSRLPPEWQVKNHRIGGKVVEFALVLPDKRLLPVDSKWPATELLERLAAAEDPGERLRLKAEIERQVRQRAAEVRKYIDPHVTVNFALAVVPDAVYDLCTGILPEVVRHGVVVVGYSLFLPYLLLVFHMALKTGAQIEAERLQRFLQEAEQSIVQLQKEIDGRLATAITMLTNSRHELNAHLGKLRSGLAGVHTLPQGEAPALEA
ncbi:MAG: hypothetical protein KatS3mg131_3457 [Candidatus Tectimicrobiota bacterium]|nr:MAG: hypothetical protein KatS3mg131_3457 [Candidatus Tectomicrobia bacterium]